MRQLSLKDIKDFGRPGGVVDIHPYLKRLAPALFLLLFVPHKVDAQTQQSLVQTLLMFDGTHGDFMERSLRAARREELANTYDIKKREYTLEQEDVVSLNIVTWNLKYLPLPFNKKRKRRKKQQEIFEMIDEYVGGNDIICLQEVFAHAPLTWIKTWAAKNNFDIFIPQKSRGTGNILNSGLVVLVRNGVDIDIMKHEFVSYEDEVGIDSKSDKGYTVTYMSVEGKRIASYNTHMNSSYPHGEYDTEKKRATLDTRKNQCRQLLQGIKEAIDQGYEITLSGDLNVPIDEFHDYFIPFAKKLGVYDALGGFEHERWGQKNLHTNEGRLSIDYNLSRLVVEDGVVYATGGASDHYPKYTVVYVDKDTYPNKYDGTNSKVITGDRIVSPQK